MNSRIFHLAIPCQDLKATELFYGERLGCRIARKYDDRVTLDFFGEQIVCHLAPDKIDSNPELYPRHFGITFINESEFNDMLIRCREKSIPFFSEPFIRFAKMREAHRSFVVCDPSNNLIEFKYYNDPEMAY